MKKIKMTLAVTWLALVSLISPIWIGIIYMDITGHGKGYSYHLGLETDISVWFGIIELVLWMTAFFPAFIWICVKLFLRKKALAVYPLIIFILLFVTGVLLLGWNNFVSAF